MIDVAEYFSLPSTEVIIFLLNMKYQLPSGQENEVYIIITDGFFPIDFKRSGTLEYF